MSYWSHTGRYQSLADQLQKLVLVSGPCPDAQGKNKHLDRFRVAANCYYDYFNNGLCNRAEEFREVFGFSGRKAAAKGFPEDFTFQLDIAMDAFVLSAAREQGLQ